MSRNSIPIYNILRKVILEMQVNFVKQMLPWYFKKSFTIIDVNLFSVYPHLVAQQLISEPMILHLVAQQLVSEAMV